MPAYRSPSEAELRDAVCAELRRARPDARHIHEINVSQFGNRIDILAVSPSELLGIEIKSAKDKLDRLPQQIEAMRSCCHATIAALHEQFLVEQMTNPYTAHYERNGSFYRGTLPEVTRRADETWIYPLRRRAMRPEPDGVDFIEQWRMPRVAADSTPGPNALGLLWRSELLTLCELVGLAVQERRPTIPYLSRLLSWNATGAQITTGICTILRARESIEADPIIPLTGVTMRPVSRFNGLRNR